MYPKRDINSRVTTKCNTQDLIIPKTTSNGGGARVVNSLKNFNSKVLANYNIIKTIGKGNFAKVKLARHKLTKKKVAIKIMDKTKVPPENLMKLFREVKIIKMLDHPNIVKLYEVLQTDATLFLVMEYVSGGELFDYLVDNGKMKECHAREKFRQIVSAIQYCHSKGIVHRDLKAENLLLDEFNNVKIVDFGFSNEYSLDSKLDTFCGSPPYAAPELFLGRSYVGPEVDIWSLGVILFTIVTGSLPFDGRTLKELKQNVLSCHLRVPFYLSPECDILLRKMIVRDPKKRKPLDIILRDKWVNLDYQKGYHLRPFTCVNETYDDNERINKMLKMGINKELIITTLQNREYNHVMATYLILDNNRLDSNFVNSNSEADELLWKMNRKFKLSSIKKTASNFNKSLDNHLEIANTDSIESNLSETFVDMPPSIPPPPTTTTTTTNNNNSIKPIIISGESSKPKELNRSKTFSADSKNDNTTSTQIKQYDITYDGIDINNNNNNNDSWTTAEINNHNIIDSNKEKNEISSNHYDTIGGESKNQDTTPDNIVCKLPYHRNTITSPLDASNQPKRQFSLFRRMRNPFKSFKNGTIDSITSVEDIDNKNIGPIENQVEGNIKTNKSMSDSFDSILNYKLMMSGKPVRVLLTPNCRKLNTKDIVESFEKISDLLIKLDIKFKHQYPYKLTAFSNWKDYIAAYEKLNKFAKNYNKPQVVSYSEVNTFILFEIEINRIIFNNFYTIKLKRIDGGSIYYKEIASCILNSLDFIIPRKK